MQRGDRMLIRMRWCVRAMAGESRCLKRVTGESQIAIINQHILETLRTSV